VSRLVKLKEFLQQNPQDSFVKHALALEYIKLGDDDTARSYFEEILEADPSYVGSYYHLARLFERNGDTDVAIQWYEKGMDAAKKAGDNHAYNELRSAWEELAF